MRKWKLGSRSRGTAMNVLTTMVCVLAMTVIVLGYLGCAGLLEKKAEISQLARKYLLRMETVGYLTENDCLQLTAELNALGATELDFTGTTRNEVSYGSAITLIIHGKVEGNRMISGENLFGRVFGRSLYEFSEQKMSTAKN